MDQRSPYRSQSLSPPTETRSSGAGGRCWSRSGRPRRPPRPGTLPDRSAPPVRSSVMTWSTGASRGVCNATRRAAMCARRASSHVSLTRSRTTAGPAWVLAHVRHPRHLARQRVRQHRAPPGLRADSTAVQPKSVSDKKGEASERMAEADIVSDRNRIERDEIVSDRNVSPAETPNPALDALVSDINAVTA